LKTDAGVWAFIRLLRGTAHRVYSLPVSIGCLCCGPARKLGRAPEGFDSGASEAERRWKMVAEIEDGPAQPENDF
jgi:hypothetical protein